jgi:hypothetical protein
LGIKPELFNDKDYKNYIRFSQAVGWYDDKEREVRGSGFVSYEELITRINRNPDGYAYLRRFGVGASFLALRLVNCNI